MRNEELIKLVETQGTLTRATLLSEVHRLDEKMDRVIQHQEKQNGWIEKNNNAITELEKKDMTLEAYQENCPGNRIAFRLQKKWFWFMAIGVLVLLYFVIEALYHGTKLGDFIGRFI